MNRRLILAISMLCFIGCAASPMQPPSNDRISPTVFLFRGFTGHWSHGLDQLSSSLRGQGFAAKVCPHSDWVAVASAIENSGSDCPVILIGHSWGADDAIRLAQRLERSRVRVRLLITLDPVTPPRVPANVDRAINFYESNGIRDILPWWRGVALSAAPATQLLNIDVRRERSDLRATDVTHGTIADSPGIQREILKEILKRPTGARLETNAVLE